MRKTTNQDSAIFPTSPATTTKPAGWQQSFLSKGFRNFAFYGYRDTVWSQERCEGFYECIAEHGFGNNFYSYQEQSLDDLWFYEAPPLLTWLKSLPQPTALMACDDNQGNRITEICKVNNIRVPDKIAILGVDNDEIICNLSDPPYPVSVKIL